MGPTLAEIDAVLGAFNQGRIAEAEKLASAMTRAHPEEGLGWKALGIILAQQGRAHEALIPMQRSAELYPDDSEAQNNLGAVLQRLRRFAEAEASFRRALALKPDYAEAQNNLGAALHRQGRLPEAEASFRQATLLNPAYGEAHSNLGLLLREMGRLLEAEASLTRAAAQQLVTPGTLSSLGVVQQEVGRLPEAEASFRRAIALKPEYADAHSNLSVLLARQGRFTEAAASARQATALNPTLAEAYNNLGTVQQKLGRLSEAEASFRQALVLNPSYSAAHQNLIFTLDLSTSSDTASQQAERKRWAERFASAAYGDRPFSNSPDPERRLRIGYVSGDFREHSAPTVFGAMLVAFDAVGFEVFAYSTSWAVDEVTASFQRTVSQWRNIAGLPDDGAAALIREDGIDILVDLSGHSAGSRLGVFARKPAPIQITAWGYLTGTGMEAMDVIFSDPVLIPEDEQRFYAEEVRYLPNAICAYFPRALPDAGALPASSGGGLVFGSFNRMGKISKEAFALWARVLRAVPGSRFLIKAGEMNDPDVRQGVLRRFADMGTEAERIILMGKTSWSDHMLAFNRIDIALDPFPHGGGVTTLEGLMMGVPVITLRWPTIVGRLSATILTALDLTDWIAATPDEYVEISVRKAGNLGELKELRQSLRARLSASIIGSPGSYVAAVEREYKALWRTWCEQRL